ncbi:DM13 domain-containing protein [soil metagenome]
MKTFILFSFILMMIACQPNNITPTAPVNNSAQPDLTDGTLLKQGMFTGIGGHTVSGTVTIYEKSSKKYIVFDPYSSQSGPDLKVYLSKNEQASEYIRIGPLMSTTGKQVYEVTTNVDLAVYPFVHIWCEKFSVEFARAPLK